MNNEKLLMLLKIVVLKILATIFALVMNMEKNILGIILVVIVTALCVKVMLEKNGFKKNLAIY